MICNTVMCDDNMDKIIITNIMQSYEINDKALTTSSICPLTNLYATNHYVGTAIDEYKSNDTFQLYFGNPNGLQY